MKSEYTFETAVARLEELTVILSSSTVTLNESVELFKEAAALIKLCEEMLKNANVEIEEISKDFIEADE